MVGTGIMIGMETETDQIYTSPYPSSYPI